MTMKSQMAYLHGAHFACHYFLLIFPTAVIAIEQAWSLDYAAALALGTPAYVCFALGTLPAGWLGDRFDGNRLIGWCFSGCGAGSVLVALAPNQYCLMAGLGLIGLFAAIYHPVGLAMVTKLANRPGHALAVNGVFGNLGLAAAALATGLLADHFGWRGAFLVPGLLAMAAGWCQARSRRRAPAMSEPPVAAGDGAKPASSRALQIRIITIVLLAAVFAGFVFNGVGISLPKLFDERLGDFAGGLSGIGSYSALVFAVAAFAQLPVGILLDRLGARAILLPLLLIEVIALVAMAKAGGLAIIPSAMVTVTLMFASIPVTGWLIGQYVNAAWRSRAFAAEYVLSLGMSALIVPLMAVLHRHGFGFDRQYLLFALAAAIVIIAAVALPRWKPSGQPYSRTRSGSPAR